MRDRVTVDSIAFARDGREIDGSVAVADLQRLQEGLHDQSGQIDYRLAGSMDKDGMASLRLRIEADLTLTCQRCLGPVKFHLESARRFELVPKGQALDDPADEPEDVEQIHADAALDVALLVEDEAILALPIAAMHEAEACAAPAATESGNEALSPFSALGALKRQ